MKRSDIVSLGVKELSEIIQKSSNHIVYFYGEPSPKLNELKDKFVFKQGGKLLKNSDLNNKVDLEKEFSKAIQCFDKEFKSVVIKSNTSPIQHYGRVIRVNDKDIIYNTLTKQPFLRTSEGRLSENSPYGLYLNIDSNSGVKPKFQYETPLIHSDTKATKISAIQTLNMNEARAQVVGEKTGLYTKMSSIKFALLRVDQILAEQMGKRQLVVTSLAKPVTHMDLVAPKADSLLAQKIKYAGELRGEIQKLNLSSKFEERIIHNIFMNCPADYTCIASHIDYTTGQTVHIYAPLNELKPWGKARVVYPMEISTLMELFPFK
jgi:hypothetical protein